MEERLLNELHKITLCTLLSAKEALTMDDASLLLGLSKSHLYKLAHKKQIPHYKSQGGKITYFNKTELNAWMLQNRVKTEKELESEVANYLVNGKSKKGGKK